MAKPKTKHGTVSSFYLSDIAQEKLRHIAFKLGMNKSEVMSKILEEYELIDFEVQNKILKTDNELKVLEAKRKELEKEKESYLAIAKQGRVISRVMRSSKDEAIQDLLNAMNRSATWDAIERIALKWSSKTGIKPNELIVMASEGKK